MPATKPQSLNQRHSTKDEIDERESAEAALTPITQLASSPPPLLQKHKYAQETWKRLIGLYSEVQGVIATAFDADLLTKYCLLEEECIWLADKRAAMEKNAARIDKLLAKKEKAKAFDAEQYVSLLQQYNALNTRVQGFDARLDGKRKLLHDLAKSLYLTPRSRAGVVPVTKPPEEQDEFGEKFDKQ